MCLAQSRQNTYFLRDKSLSDQRSHPCLNRLLIWSGMQLYGAAIKSLTQGIDSHRSLCFCKEMLISASTNYLMNYKFWNQAIGPCDFFQADNNLHPFLSRCIIILHIIQYLHRICWPAVSQKPEKQSFVCFEFCHCGIFF